MKKALSILLSFAIIFTSVGLSVTSHYCGVKKVKTVLGIGNHNLSCGMVEVKNDCDSPEMLKSDCCKNEQQVISINDDYTPSILKLNYPNVYTFVHYTTLIKSVNVFTNDNFVYTDYSPPPPSEDIIILVQSFLI